MENQMVKLKVGRVILDISDSDLILDNGSCYQIINKTVGLGPGEYFPIMSKKLFNDLRKCYLIFTNEELKQAAVKRYRNSQVMFWKFDIDAMKKLGY